MRKIFKVIFAILLISNYSSAQTTYTWTGGAAGDYQVSSNWSPTRSAPAANDVLAFNATSVIAVNNVPNQTIGAIRIASGTNIVSFATNVSTNTLTLGAVIPLIYTTPGSILSADFLTINLSSAAAFTMSSGTFGIADGTGGKISINGALTLSASGILDFDVAGTGGTTITGSVTYNSGVFSSINPASIIWAAGSNYFHGFNGTGPSAIPVSTWQTGSTCNINGMNSGNIAPTGFADIFFANITWNCNSQSGNVDLLPAGTVMNIIGTLTIANTNNKELRLSSAGKATIKTGTYIQTGGIVTLQAAADTTTLSVSGQFTQSVGTLNGVGGTSAGTAIIDFKGNVTKSAGTVWQSNSSSTGSQLIVQFSGGSGQTVIIAGTWSAPSAGRCNIVNTNSDQVNGINLNGTLKVMNTGSAALPATFTMKSVITGSSGFVTYTGAGTGGTTLVYSGGFFQTASVIEYPVTNGPLNLTINNLLGISFPPGNFSRTIAGTLSMLNGNLTLGGDTLLLANPTLTAQLNYIGGFITTGTLARAFPITGLPTDTSNSRSLFPFGAGDNNRSLRIYFSSGSLSGGTAGMIYVTHSPIVGVFTISPTIADNGISLDKRTFTNWNISTGAFNLGSGGETISLSVVGGNIGSVDDFTKLRLTDGVSGYGNLINVNSGSNSVPVTGKSGLQMSDINKPLYIGSDGTTVYNPLIIITFNWTGLGGNTDWTNPGNWTGVNAVGFPNASTEIAIINSTSGTQPTIKTTDNISLFQLTVGGGMTLTMNGNAVINVYDTVKFSGGTAVFAPSSTFGYASSNSQQYIHDLPYGNLSLLGTAGKTLAPSITVTGNYNITGSWPVIGTGTFTFAGTGAQRVAATNYYNLTITGNHSNAIISLGPQVNPANTISIAHDFIITATNYIGKSAFNTVDFISAGPQSIPGFTYSTVRNSGNGPRVLDPLGTADSLHVISVVSYDHSSLVGGTTVTGSKVKYVRTSNTDIFGGAKEVYNDLEISGTMPAGSRLDFINSFYIKGKFSITATGFKQGTSASTFNFNGTTDQTIPAFRTNNATNTPSFKFSNVIITGGNRNVTLAGSNTDTIGIRGSLSVSSAFSAGKGFIVDSSTVSFSVGSSTIPVLKPSAGINNYNNIHINGGTHNLAGNMTIGGNLSVTGVDTLPGTLIIGNGGNPLPAPPPRVVNILGNMVISGTGAGSLATGQIDMNTGTIGITKVNLAGNLLISGNGQLMGTTEGTGSNNGVIVFNGTKPQSYNNTSTTFKNGLVNFTVGDGTIPNSKLTLLSSLDLVRSLITSPGNIGTFTVLPTDSLDCGTFNIITNTNNGAAGNAKFDLQAGATLITSNTGGIEGTATNPSNGSIINDATIAKVYSPTACYVFNASTTTPFPAAITPMANLTIGDNAAVTLNKSVEVSNTLTFRNAIIFALSNFDLTLKSTAGATARVAPVPSTAILAYGTGRFVVERYYPMSRSWRLVTSPLSNTGNIFDSWQEGAPATYVPGKGMFVTGPNPTGSGGNGLDYSGFNNYSMKTYNSATNSYVNIGDTKLQNLSANTLNAASIGYYAFVRGDRNRSPDNTVVGNMNNTTLRSRGYLQTGTQTFNVSNIPVTFPLIGNPYASSVDFNKISKVGINPKRFYVYDPSLGTLGLFVTMEENPINSGNFLPSTPATSVQRNFIQSSQAFFAETDGSNDPATAVIFDEDNKSTDYNPVLFRPVTPLSQPGSFRTNLFQMNADNTTLLVDGNLAQFDVRFNDKVDIQDALKFTNVNENLGFLRFNKLLAVERRQPLTVDDTLFFKLTKTTQRNYQFQFEPVNLDPTITAFLEDSYTGDRTPVSVTSASEFNFTINGDPKSAANNRFKIVFKVSGTGPLPVSYSSIKAYQRGADIAVDWTVENEINTSKYEVEKSTDGVNFGKVNTTVAKGANSGSASYNYLDLHAVQGNNFYRVLSYNKTGAYEYSRVVVVKLGKSGTGISIYPNPVTGNIIGVAFNNMGKGIYQVKLINTLGQTLMTRQLTHTTGSSMETLTPGSKLSTGIYQLEVTDPDKRISTIKVIVQ